MVVAAGVGIASSPAVGAALLLAFALLLLPPTVASYGSMGGMTPAWLAWLVSAGVWGVRLEGRRSGWRGAIPVVVVAVAALLLVQIFCIPSAYLSRLLSFHPMWPSLSPRTSALPLVAWVAKLVVFMPLRGSLPGWRASVLVRWLAPPALIGVLAATGVAMLQAWGDARHHPLMAPSALLVAGFGWWIRKRRSPLAEYLGEVATLVSVWLLLLYMVRVDAHLMAAFDCFAAVAVASGWLASRVPAAGSRPLLVTLALLASGWSVVAFSFHRLEWQFLYDWLPAPVVEEMVVWLSPLLLGRYALATWVLCRLLSRHGEGAVVKQWPATLGLAAIVGVVCLGLGLAMVAAESRLYMDAWKHVAVLLGVSIGALPTMTQKS